MAVSRRKFLKKAGILAAVGLAGVAGVDKGFGTTTGPPITRPYNSLSNASYILYPYNGAFYAQNGNTGQVDYSGPDAATVIQSAADTLVNGGLVFLRRGVYLLSKAIVISKSNISLVGEGNSTKLVCDFSGITPDNAISIGLGLTESISNLAGQIAGVEVADCSIDMRQTSSILTDANQENYGNGIEVFGSLRCRIRNVSIGNPHTHGIYFRAASPSTTPAAPSNIPLKDNSVENCSVENSSLAVYFDAVSSYPSATQGYGNKAVSTKATLDWEVYDADSQNDGSGFVDWGNVATTFLNCHAEGYTPNPSIPSHTSFQGFAADGAGSPRFIGCSCFNCYSGIKPNPSGGGGGVGVQVRNLTTYFVRYPIHLQGGSDDDITVEGLTAINLVDSVNKLAGAAIFVNPYSGSNIKSISATNVRAIRDASFDALFGTITGDDSILQTVGDPAKYVSLIGGDQTGMALDAVIRTPPSILKIQEVKGYNPKGVAAITVGDSPFTYVNNDGVSEAIYITGGIVSEISKNNHRIFSSAPATVWLEPGDSLTVVHADRPNILKDRK